MDNIGRQNISTSSRVPGGGTLGMAEMAEMAEGSLARSGKIFSCPLHLLVHLLKPEGMWEKEGWED